jgi:hypothetical protein
MDRRTGRQVDRQIDRQMNEAFPVYNAETHRQTSCLEWDGNNNTLLQVGRFVNCSDRRTDGYTHPRSPKDNWPC